MTELADISAGTSQRRSVGEWIDARSGRLMVLPAILILLCFAIFPLIISAYLALSRFALAPGGFTLEFIGLRNFRKLLTGSQQYHLLGVFGPFGAVEWTILTLFALGLLALFARYLKGDAVTIVGLVGRLISAALAVFLVTLVLATLVAGGIAGTMVTTLIYVVMGVGVQFLLGLGLALLCAQPVRGRNFFRVLFFVPLMVTPVGIAYTFRMLADMQKGPFAPLVRAFGITEWSWATEAWSARMMVLVGDTWQWTPFLFIVLVAAIENQPRDQVEAARLDGAGGWQVFRDITWPAIAPVAATVVLIRLIEAFKIIDLPNVLTGGGPGLATEFDDAPRVHRVADTGSRRLGGRRLSAAVRRDGDLHLVLHLRGSPRAQVRVVSDGHRTLRQRLFEPATLEQAAPVPRLATYALLILWSLVVLIPLYWVFITAFKTRDAVDNGPFYVPFVDFTPSLQAWDFMLVQNNTMGPYLNSVIIALGSTFVAVIVGALAAYALVRTRLGVKLATVAVFLILLAAGIAAVVTFGVPWPLALTAAICLFVIALFTVTRRARLALGNRDIEFWIISNRILPPIVAVLPIYIMFQQLRLLDTRIALIATYAAVNLPIVVWLTRDFFAAIPIDLEESAEIDGASKFRVFFTIALPLVRSGLIATFLLVLILAWNEYLLALFLTNADAQTMPVLVSAQNTTRGPQWWNMSVLIVIMIAPVLLIATVLQKHIARGLLAGAVKG